VKYITRVDRDRHHCWMVAIAPKEKWGAGKSFFDRKCNGKDKALNIAIKYRNKELNRLKKELVNYVRKVRRPKKQLVNRIIKGWSEHWATKGAWQYLFIHASLTKNKKTTTKKFSVNKYGYDKAISLALKWRKEKLKELYG